MLKTANTTDVEAFLPIVEGGANGLFRPDRVRYLARAPGRLDVMGGVADATGSLVVASPLHEGVVLAAQKRNDRLVEMCCLDPQTGQTVDELSWSLSQLYASDGQLLHADRFLAGLEGAVHSPGKAVSALIYALLERNRLPPLTEGFTLAVWLGITAGCGAGGMAALQVAAAQCLATLYGVQLDSAAVVAACQHARRTIMRLPVGPMDPLVALHGEPDGLLQVQCCPARVAGTLPVPQGTRFLGIDSGKRHPQAEEKYRDAYAAAAMGFKIIEALIRRHGADPLRAIQCLADVQPADFVTRFRDLLPTRLRGREFTRQLPEGLGEACPIEASKVYKVRSRTEHHVYENQRVHEFVSLLARARHTGQVEHLDAAGQLMYSSHWSYGQRCGLGSLETDLLVNQLRKKGLACGIYGARVSGGGAGGMVTVFCADGDRARSAIQEALDTYRAKTGIQPTCHEGSSEGALAFRPRRIE